jgi:hypothetical protein
MDSFFLAGDELSIHNQTHIIVLNDHKGLRMGVLKVSELNDESIKLLPLNFLHENSILLLLEQGPLQRISLNDSILVLTSQILLLGIKQVDLISLNPNITLKELDPVLEQGNSLPIFKYLVFMLYI